jgi:hypothetical protein
VATVVGQLYVGRCWVRILTGTPVILTEVFRGFSQSLQVNVRILPLLSHNRHLPNPFQFIFYPNTLR